MSNKISKDMISTMSKSSLKTSRLRNIFVMIIIQGKLEPPESAVDRVLFQ